MPSTRPLSSFALLFALACASLPAAAVAPATGKHVVLYASSGPGRPDGYVNAQVTLQYQFTDCPGGITLGFRLTPGAVVSEDYFHQGAHLNAIEAPPRIERVEFSASVMYRGSRIARLNFLGNNNVSASSRLGCGGLTVGRFPDFLPKGYTEADKEQMFRELVIWTDTSPNTLTNPAIGRRVQRERQEAEAKRLAEQRAAAQAEQQKAEQQRAEQQKLEQQNARQQVAQQGGQAPGRGQPGGGQQPGQAQLSRNSTSPATTTMSRPTGTTPALSEGQRQAELRLQQQARQRQEEQRRAQRNAEQSVRNLSNHLTFEAATRDTSRRIASLTRLSDSIDSIDELEDEYQRRSAEIHAEMDRYAAQQQAAAANVHRAFDNHAVGMATQNFVATVQRYNNNNARHEALDELRRERERMLAQLERRRHQALLGGRQALLDEFQDASLPRYSDRIAGGVVYYFAYSLNPNEIKLTRTSPAVYITNVFPVAQRGDGGWPLRQRLDAELAKVMPQGRPVTLSGYFLNEKEATEMRDAFVRVAGQSRLALKELAFDSRLGKRTGAVANFWGGGGATASAPTDFWGDGKPSPSASAPAAATVDFWDSGATASPARPAAPVQAPSEDDFWR